MAIFYPSCKRWPKICGNMSSKSWLCRGSVAPRFLNASSLVARKYGNVALFLISRFAFCEMRIMHPVKEASNAKLIIQVLHNISFDRVNER